MRPRAPRRSAAGRTPSLDRPLQTVGAVLEASSFHPGRTAANHLAVVRASRAASRDRASTRCSASSGSRTPLGARSAASRSGCASDWASPTPCSATPACSCSTSPRTASTPRASSGCADSCASSPVRGARCSTSSHLLAEVQQTVDSLLVISQGRLVFAGGLDELADPSEYATVVDSPDRAALATALTAAGVTFEVLRSGLTVRGLEPAEVGATRGIRGRRAVVAAAPRAGARRGLPRTRRRHPRAPRSGRRCAGGG